MTAATTGSSSRAPRQIFAHLLSFKPTAQEIAQWLQNPAEIDRLLAGTELASMIDPTAPSQRAGVLASLSMVGESFQLIPDRAETTGTWSAYEWAQHRKGWLFLTSTPQTLDRLRPLIIVWLDLLLMRLLSGGSPVWVFLDELPTLNKLPKLPEALALARKPNVRLVIGFQGRAQLETRYDQEAEAMLSQPATKVFLRTSEPRAAEWISKALGEIEFERLQESVNYDKLLAVKEKVAQLLARSPDEAARASVRDHRPEEPDRLSEIRELRRPDPVRSESRPATATGIRRSSDQDGRFTSERQTRPTDRVSPAGQRRPAVFSNAATCRVAVTRINRRSSEIRTSSDAHDLPSAQLEPGAEISRGGVHQPLAVVLRGGRTRPRRVAGSSRDGLRAARRCASRKTSRTTL